MRCLVALLAVLMSGAACGKGTSATKKETQGEIPDRRIERLRTLIALPAPPAEVWFEVVPRGTPGGLGPTDYLLVAVLRFEHGDLVRLAARARARSDARISGTVNRDWFPEPVKAALRPTDDHGVVVRGNRFDGALFAKSPFLTGSFIVVDGGGYAILALATL